MQYEVQETIIRTYRVDAESFRDAIDKASELTTPDEESSDGFTYVLNLDDLSEMIL